MREVSFADGFVSSTAPTSTGIGQEDYEFDNDVQVFSPIEDSESNQIVFNEAEYSSMFILAEVERTAFENIKRQSIELHAVFNGAAWVLTSGLSTGDDILQLEEATEDFQLVLRIQDGVLEYMSGNMSDHILSKLKLITTKVKA